MITLSFNTFTLLISITVIIALSFGLLLLLSSHTQKSADRFLAALVFMVAFWNVSILLLEVNLYRYAAGIIWIPFKYTLAIGPCLYFYVHAITHSDITDKRRVWPHFIPVTVEVLMFLSQVFIGLPQHKAYFQTQLFQMVDPVISILAVMSVVIYSFYSWKLIQHYDCWVENNYSHHHRYQLNWLKRLLPTFFTLFLIYFVFLVGDYFFYDYQLTFKDYYPFHLTLAGISIWLCFEAYSKPDIIFPDANVPVSESAEVNIDSEIANQADWLKETLEKNRLYLDPELSLKSLAVTLDLHPNLVSRIINEGLGKSFSECINHYRVEAVKRLLSDPQHRDDTFLAIAHECGFNSKTTFNRIFKKFEGQTPLDYRKKQRV
ncbi:AraC family transcriptional regulator [Alteromonas sediminis]|uniref:AraC family transcriptional regulator n=1 Tax=Alteromonas sediminis TaxID=2259342 RepID=A0A3N5XZ07_9ALTE|nr:AraC family transcriptional regulator [Alteromonas sediminis]RPJ65930.1 AraC family transcriptional regulator [Alteromonas sediminis]